ncbi:hypothetical protein [Schlesneria paludicola]|uniref:hypothetical protein n=1 Tax=Schlesneria paludicola TaxID=360056 RepID=UPI00029A2ED3|nr:hypothetical protein [Schlesneria paludicola]
MFRELPTKLILAVALTFSGVSSATAGVWPFDVNSRYISGCRSGNCGGGDYYVGGWFHGCCHRKCQTGHRAYVTPSPSMPASVNLPAPAPASMPTPR